jgi:predicted TIM-barrel fold metal-dependent hydrolase
MQGFSALRYANLAVSCPKTKIIFAHMGGHHVIDFMMLAKRIPNVYFDISYSWLYYQSSSVIGDMAYAMRSMKFDRVFYGSDYPDRPIQISLDMSINLLKKHNLSEAEFKKIMFENARDFYNWHEL